MSFLIGPLSGALVAGGVYYGFSNLISTRTERLSNELQTLSVRLLESPSVVQAPPSAATRITHHPFTSMLKEKWNKDVEYLFASAADMDRRALEWGRSLLHGRNGEDTTQDSKNST